MSAIGQVISEIERALAPLEEALGQRSEQPGAWFDGFWDFVVENRARIQAGPAWQIAGMTEFPWCLLIILAHTAAHPSVEIYLFVEDKDRRPSARAPWPVSSVVIPGNDPVRVGKPDALDRPHDKALAAAITRLGFAPRLGYWGIRCDWLSPQSASIKEVADAVQRALAADPTVLHRALELAMTT